MKVYRNRMLKILWDLDIRVKKKHYKVKENIKDVNENTIC